MTPRTAGRPRAFAGRGIADSTAARLLLLVGAFLCLAAAAPPQTRSKQTSPLSKTAAATPMLIGVVDKLVRMPVDWDTSSYPKIRWNDVEGLRHFLNPAYADDFVVSVCEDHFAVGSQGRINLEEALRKIDRVSGAAIGMTIEEGPHRCDAPIRFCPALYGSPVGKANTKERIHIEMAALSPHGTVFDATASVFHYFEDFNGSPEWKWGGRDQPTPRKSDYVVLAVQSIAPKGYTDYTADPLGEVDKAPTVGVFAHELGHAFHFSHDNDRLFPGTLARPLAERLFNGHASLRGGDRNLFHAFDNPGGTQHDIRTGGVTAFSKALLRNYYPTAAPPARDAKPQWYNHVVLILEDPDTGPDAIVGATFADHNPAHLRYDAGGDIYRDCFTGNKPVYRMQYSDASSRDCNAVIEPEVTVAFVHKGTQLASRSHENQDCDHDFIQYDWSRTLTLRSSVLGTPPAGGTSEELICGRVDPDKLIPEHAEDDNRRCVNVTLYADGLVTPDCPN